MGSNGVDDNGQMANETDENKRGAYVVKPGKRTEHDVTKGLKQLYDSVLDEPLPASFHELLTKLDLDKR